MYRSIAAELAKTRQKTSFPEKQCIFWMESAKFLINELEIWDNLGDTTKYDATARRLQKNLDLLNELITQLTEEQSSDLDSSE